MCHLERMCCEVRLCVVLCAISVFPPLQKLLIFKEQHMCMKINLKVRLLHKPTAC